MEVELIEKATCNVSNIVTTEWSTAWKWIKKIILDLLGVIVDSKRVVLSEYG